MHGIIKAMLIKELLENNYVIGYRFKKILERSNIKASNGAIYYNLKKFEENHLVVSQKDGKTNRYIITEKGKKTFQKNLDLVPKNIEITMQELASHIPFINWQSYKDVLKFTNTINKLSNLLNQHLEDLE